MEIKNYLISCAAALAVSFGAGVYVGYKNSKDIEYAFCKVEKEACLADRSLKKWTPRVVASVVNAVDDIKRDMILDMHEQEAEKKQKDMLEHLDEVINEYESNK